MLATQLAQEGGRYRFCTQGNDVVVMTREGRKCSIVLFSERRYHWTY